MGASESVLGRATVTVGRPVWRQILIVFGELHCRLFHNSLSRRGRARSGTMWTGALSLESKAPMLLAGRRFRLRDVCLLARAGPAVAKLSPTARRRRASTTAASEVAGTAT